ncbi:hypothetical protein EXIGLDRAFT_770269 [Exidia glandulosa HHB12029]|uniref:Uncharacterized protein n=1 Tax=Exidia glandulosa HHB12029 TaxID=1314781 RepID=A0A166AE17_EXIGL|nr:hypothetical protein EXIGLDRAFT_770269 [Exidia glandulosa HHB12029]
MITCQSDKLQKSVWTFNTYVVSNNEYFDNFYLHAPKSSRTSTVSDDVLQDRKRIAKELEEGERIARERFAKEHAKKGKLPSL